MKRLFILVIYALSGSFMLQAQEAKEAEPLYTHTVYRTDGSVLKGELTEWNADHMKLRLLSGVEIVLNVSDVKKVVSKSVVKARGRATRPHEYTFKDKGIYHVTSTSFSTGPTFGLGITHAVGYRFSRMLGAGVGVGAESFELGSGRQVVPIYAEARGFLTKQNISPYYALRAGYGFAIANEENALVSAKGGRMFGAELGYRFTGDRAFNVFAGIGVHFQKATYRYEWQWEQRFTDVVSHRRTELKIGVIF